jgi:hypothetical protein
MAIYNMVHARIPEFNKFLKNVHARVSIGLDMMIAVHHWDHTLGDHLNKSY